jgi:hypothetical protein
MDEPNSNPGFEARRLMSASGWYVRVAWPNGKHDHNFLLRTNRTVVLALLWAVLAACVVGSLVYDVADWLSRGETPTSEVTSVGLRLAAGSAPLD